MVRPPDPFWSYAEEMNDGYKKCMFCEHIFTRGTSVSRVKRHLSGLRSCGVKICESVPTAVREAAHAAIDGPSEKKLKPAGSSSDTEAGDTRIPASSPGQNSEAENGMTYLSPGAALECLLTLVDEIGPDDGGTCPKVLMVDPAETAIIIEEGGQEEMQMDSQSPTTLQPTDPECRDDFFMNDKENMNIEPEQTIVRNRGMIEHQVEGTIRGGLMVNAVEATLKPAQVSQDCEPTRGIPYLLTEDNCVGNNLECASMGMQHIEGGAVLTVDEDGRPTYLQRQVSNQICSPSVFNEVLRNDEGTMTREPKQTIVGDGYRESLQQTTGDQARGVVFPTSKLLGGAFEENKNVIWSWLMNDEVSLVGIYGMGGVGKTTLLKHINNQLLNMPNKHREAYWITVPQDFSIYKLQKLIAERIGLDLSNENDEMHRAAKLLKVLAGRQNYVLILDDLWDHFEPEEVGIPSKMDGCKVILTTRSLNVCRQMRCEGNMIKVEPLLKEEAWNLFRMELGSYDIKLEHLAKSVADECDGLPLGIRTMARSMRGVYDEREWRTALEELKKSRVRQRDMEPQVFRILKFSYLHLNDSALRQCFLYCALFPEDFEIERKELIELFISEGMIKGRQIRAEAFDKGHEMLNQLVNACLLESEGFSDVKMHNLFRDMALQQMREESNVIVEAGEQLEELPYEEKWTQNIVRVSLMETHIVEIPSSHSPRCPNLSTLLLRRNYLLEFIGDSFFKHMQGLKLLDLSYTAIKKLPDSISDLVTLTALLLEYCSQLAHVPSLGKLKALKKLDLHGTALREVPRGLELLSSLEYLDLNRTPYIREIPAGILPKHCHLQVLRLGFDSFPIMVKAEELACLRKLETLECRFDDLLALKKYLKELDHDKKKTQQPSIFKCLVGHWKPPDHLSFVGKDFDRAIRLYGQVINRSCGDAWLLPKGIEGLAMEECFDMKSLCDFYPSQNETKLKYLSIIHCQSMECLVSSSQMSKSMLGTIADLHLKELGELRCLYSKEGAAPTPLVAGDGIFSHLKTLKISYCRKLETLFPPGLLLNLQNLESIDVGNCVNLENIICKEKSNISSNDLAIEFSLPKLRVVILDCLPTLMSIGCGKLICNSLHTLEIISCERLKRLPFSCSPETLSKITVGPKVWWESVEWDLRNDYPVQFGGDGLYGLIL